MTFTPKHLDVLKSKGLHIEWANGSTSFLPTHHLRRMSPSADSKATREELNSNPLAILPKSDKVELLISDAQLVGNYAIKLTFSDGRVDGSIGIYRRDFRCHRVTVASSAKGVLYTRHKLVTSFDIDKVVWRG